MNTDVEQLFQAALHLPEVQRVELAEMLYESLDVVPDSDVAEAWKAEIARRIAAFDEARDPTVPWQVIERRLMSRLR